MISVAAAALLIALKLGVGLLTGSLGLISEAAHSGTDLVAALLTLFAVGVAGRPADESHAWGHGKAEHLSALAEAAILAAVSVVIGYFAVRRLTGEVDAEVEATWYAFAVLGIVIVVDVSRMVVSLRTARRYGSAALHANAIHFAGDLAGTLAVLVGLLLVRAGHPRADAAAALFVAVLVVIAAARLARANIDVLMDRTPDDAERAAREALLPLAPGIVLERLRMRHAGGRHFADVVISVSPSAALVEGHAAADTVEAVLARTIPGVDVVVHVEPGGAPDSLTERALTAALSVTGVREIHNVRVARAADHLEVSLHLKFPGDAPLETAHAVATDVEHAICGALPGPVTVTTHLEPLDEPVAAERPPLAAVAAIEDEIDRVVRRVTGREPRETRFIRIDGGLVALLTVTLGGDESVAAAHEAGGTIRSQLRRACPDLADVVVHTEPAAPRSGAP
jgi:cation diffusion facilitator family transporter